MKKLTMVLLISLLLSSCNSREDVKHLSQNRLIWYVKSSIGEKVSFVGVESIEDNVEVYIFNIDERNIEFRVVSVISAPSIDGSRIGNYKRKIGIGYAKAIADSEYYKEKRIETAQLHDLDIEHSHAGSTRINISNYTEIEKAARFIVDMDKVYAFRIRRPLHVSLVDSGPIVTDINSIAGVKFSTSRWGRLKYKAVHNQITVHYIRQLKAFDDYDDTIPKSLWERYGN